jgi:membrane protease YdiL (CAAX protease family)
VSSAVLFAAMHGPLMRSPLGVKGGRAIVLLTLGVGWACAVLRARSKSLLPAIACHVIGNVAGVPGGIIGVIIYRLVYGRHRCLSLFSGRRGCRGQTSDESPFVV